MQQPSMQQPSQQHSEMCEASRKVICVLLGSLPAWVARHRHLLQDTASFQLLERYLCRNPMSVLRTRLLGLAAYFHLEVPASTI
jgi:hypothetical protein